MKKLILISFSLLIGVFLMTLSACTKSELKKLAIAQADSEYRETLRKEIEDVEMAGRLRDNYLSFLQNTAKYDVVDIKMPSDTTAVVSVSQSAVPIENRKTLANIAATITSDKATSFNMGNAINLIEQQPGQVRGKKETLYFIRIQKGPNGWKVEK